MTLRYYEQVKDYLHPHLHNCINYYGDEDIISGCYYDSIMDVIVWIETEQERKLVTIWAINALIQLRNIIGAKRRINIKEK